MTISDSILKTGQHTFFEGRRIVWFSCGAASAVTAKFALELYGPSVLVIYCNTLKEEHPDNPRFMADCEKWFNHPIMIISSAKYSSPYEVAEGERYMAGPNGAKCTTELKKVPRFKFQSPDDTHFFGFTADESDRIADFERDNFELQLEWILRDRGITKRDCYHLIRSAGIPLPTMYNLGYRNNNCLGCFKATGAGYWNKVRKDFPEVFARRSEQSRRLGVRLVQLNGERVFLDELPEGVGRYKGEDLSCGPQCSST